MRFIIVVRANLAAAANRAGKRVDTIGGERTWTAPLVDAGGVTRAYWCSWLLGVQRAQAIRDRLVEEGATQAEVTPVPPGGAPVSNRFAVFNADDWTPDQVLAAVGLQRPASDA